MECFVSGDFVFTTNVSLTVIVGTNNDTLGNGALLKTDYSGPAIIPSFVNSPNGNKYKVIGTGKYTFRGCTLLSSVTLPRSLLWVGWDSFHGTAITEIFIPSNVELFDYAALASMKNLALITIESGSKLTHIGRKAFAQCSVLKTIVLPPSIIQIDREAFYSASSLHSIAFCSSVDMSNIITPFLQIENNVVIYVSSRYPASATFGNFPVIVSDSYCNYYFIHPPPQQISSNCLGFAISQYQIYTIFSFLIFISHLL